MEWRRVGRSSKSAGLKTISSSRPHVSHVPPNGAWVCASCDPEEHEDYARGLVELGQVIGREPS